MLSLEICCLQQNHFSFTASLLYFSLQVNPNNFVFLIESGQKCKLIQYKGKCQDFFFFKKLAFTKLL